MATLDPDVLDAAEQRAESLLIDELIALAERMDDAVDRGVPVARLEAYADEIASTSADGFDAEDLDALLEQRLTDAETWSGPEALYEVGDGVSAFPPRWHEQLAGEADMRRVVAVISEGLAESDASSGHGGPGRGVEKELLLDAASALTDLDRRTAAEDIERLRRDGELEELADQHPHARVRLAPE